MPSVHVERLPVQSLGLGVLGFDHLQLVFRSGFDGTARPQDDWFVIEGLREPDGAGVRLAVEGWHGGTTLSEANGGLTGAVLADRIGTAEERGAREIASGGAATALWADLVSFAADIEAQRFPYIALALPASPLPTLNSTSLIASLLHQAGIDVGSALPHGIRFSPGMATLLGTSRDDRMRAGDGFSTLVGGDGADDLAGSADPGQIDKLYGGRGDDVLHWSPGFAIVHGGQPGLAYADDGRDTIDCSGAGTLRLDAPEAPEAHLKPDFIATTADGVAHLYSIEEIAWDGASDRLVIGKGVGLAQTPLLIDLGAESATGRGDVLDLSQSDVGLSVEVTGRAALHLSARGDPGGAAAGGYRGGVSVAGAEWIVGSAHGDRMVLPSGLRGVEGGAGDDTFVIGNGPLTIAGGAGADRYVIADPEARLVIGDPSAEDRIVLAGAPSRVALAYDASPGRDLVIRIGFAGDKGSGAEIVAREFHAGDLGLDLARGVTSAGEDACRLILASDPGTELVESLYGVAADAGAFEPRGFGDAGLWDGGALSCLPPPS